MKRIRRPNAKAKPAARGGFSRALVLVTLIAFMLQGFLIQTHIHGASTGSTAVVDVFDGVPGPAQDKSPAKNDQANCPLCQQFASSGQFVTPAAAAVLLPSLGISVIEVVAIATHFAAPVTHDWRGRAPPLG